MNKIFPIIAIASLIMAGCTQTPPSSDQIQQQQQEVIKQEGVKEVGMPSITNFFEMRQLKQIYEMRDDPHYSTITYLTDFSGHLHQICKSIGYGIPSATQFTNPQRLASEYQYPTNGSNTGTSSSLHTVDGVISQSDPNGLFSPVSAEATWVLCVDPNEKNPAKAVKPLYFEPRVIISPFELPHAD